MKAIRVSYSGARASALLLAGTVLAGLPAIAAAQTTGKPPVADPQPSSPPPAPLPPPVTHKITAIRVEGSQRLEPETVLSYTRLRVGQTFTNETLDQAIKDLYASDLFADATIEGAQTGNLVLRVRENPIINRVIFEGNKRLKEDKIKKEVKLAPRQIFTRTAVRQDVARIVELYRRQGRFAAVVDPKMVSLDQNRVDVIFEVSEGPKSKVRQINILGNEVFSDSKLREQMATKQARLSTLLSSNTSYDQDRLSYDQSKLRQFYLTEGYADFKIISAVAELTPDKKDFIITYVVEEGKRYKFGDVTVDSDIRDFDNKLLAASLGMKKGDWYDAKKVETSIDSLSEAAGLFGYAFTEVNPDFLRDKDTLTMGINFHIAEAKRTYVERVDITGNTQTQDKVIRREIRLSEGDAFNSFQVKRSQDRINSLGYFQDKFEIKQSQGSAPDRVVLTAAVEEKSTGELSLSAGFSSLERFIIQASIRQRNFRGKGQELRTSVNYSTFSRSVEVGFTEPYLFDKSIAVAADIFRRDFNQFNFLGNTRQTTYTNVSSGFQLRTGIPLTEYWQLAGRYGLSYEQIGLARESYFTDSNNDGLRGNSPNDICDPLFTSRFLCDAIGNRWISSIGYSLVFDSLNSRLRPTAGQRFVFSQDLAGLGGDVRFFRTKVEGAKFWNIGSGFIASLTAEGGYIRSLEKSRGALVDRVRITDRFYLGEPDFRGFDIRGVGPRVQRIPYIADASGNLVLTKDRNQITDDPLGGRAYYLGKFEIEIPLGSGARELGLRPSIYVQAGALFGITRPTLQTEQPYYVVPSSETTNPNAVTTCAIGYSATIGGPCVGTSVNTLSFLERFAGNSPRPRVSIGAGVNWNSPFGPLRIDIARALVRDKGDDPKLIQFNVGTQF